MTTPSPYLAASLADLRRQVNMAWPDRDRTSDGWIGDAAHQARQSDHNPDSRGCVHALDLDKDGLHVPTVIASCLAYPGTHYTIHNRKIWQSEDDFRPRAYLGINPHTGHIHESIRYEPLAEANSRPWWPLVGWPTLDFLRLGDTGRNVRLLQAYLNAYGAALAVDGDFGPATHRALGAFQAAHGLQVDGICGPRTRFKLRTS